MPDHTSLEGPLEDIDGRLVIRIPMSAGGAELAPYAENLREPDNEFFTVVIQPWLAEKLRVGAGSLVIVDNKEGKFTITRSASNDESPS